MNIQEVKMLEAEEDIGHQHLQNNIKNNNFHLNHQLKT